MKIIMFEYEGYNLQKSYFVKHLLLSLVNCKLQIFTFNEIIWASVKEAPDNCWLIFKFSSFYCCFAD